MSKSHTTRLYNTDSHMHAVYSICKHGYRLVTQDICTICKCAQIFNVCI